MMLHFISLNNVQGMSKHLFAVYSFLYSFRRSKKTFRWFCLPKKTFSDGRQLWMVKSKVNKDSIAIIHEMSTQRSANTHKNFFVDEKLWIFSLETALDGSEFKKMLNFCTLSHIHGSFVSTGAVIMSHAYNNHDRYHCHAYILIIFRVLYSSSPHKQAHIFNLAVFNFYFSRWCAADASKPFSSYMTYNLNISLFTPGTVQTSKSSS